MPDFLWIFAAFWVFGGLPVAIIGVMSANRRFIRDEGYHPAWLIRLSAFLICMVVWPYYAVQVARGKRTI